MFLLLKIHTSKNPAGMLSKVVVVEKLKVLKLLWVFKPEDSSLSHSESLLVGNGENGRKMGCCHIDSVSKWEIVGVVEPDCRP